MEMRQKQYSNQDIADKLQLAADNIARRYNQGYGDCMLSDPIYHITLLKEAARRIHNGEIVLGGRLEVKKFRRF